MTFFTENLNDNVSEFTGFLNDLYCKYFRKKIKYVNCNRLNKPWITSDLLHSIKSKSHYLKLYKRGIISFDTYSSFRNNINRIVDRTKKNYYRSYFQTNWNNPNRTWKGIKNLMDVGQVKCLIREIKTSDGTTIAEPDQIAESFNNIFSSVANDLDSNIPISNISPSSYIRSNQNSIFLRPTTPLECEKIIENLKNVKSGPNEFPVKLYKHYKSILSVPISILVNKSFSSGSFPVSLKSACVTPVFKSGDKYSVLNYRPISILPFLSKILEKCLVLRILNFANKYKLFSEKQFGFLQKRSTIDAISSLIEHIYTALNERKSTIALFLDLRRAFDTVNHSILLEKLQLYGIRGNVLNLIKSYLTDRTQCVRIGDSLSSYKTMNIGVGQGSIIGPILFLFYINDLPNVSKLLKTVLFADDTTLFLSHDSSNSVYNDINGELCKFSEWFNANRISVNLDKTYFSIFSTRNFIIEDLFINHVVVRYEEQGRFLGVFLDNKLTFSNHVTHICSKLSKTVGIMYKISKNIPLSVRISLYYSLFYPYLIYCNLIWGGAAKTNLNPIILLQKKILRIICGADFLSHTNDLFFQTKILKFPDVHIFLLCLYFYKNANSFTNHSHQYSTRNSDHIVPTFQRLTITQRSLNYAAPNAWNDLPAYLKSIPKYSSFKCKLKEYLVQKYNPE